MSATTEILSYLKSGKTLTVLECLKLFKTHKLSSRVSEFRAQGINIETKFIFTGKGKQKKKIAEYKLKKKK